MPVNRLLISLGLICFHFAPVELGAQTPAGSAPAAAAPPSPLRVTSVRETVPEVGDFIRAYLATGTNQFAFLVPGGFRLRGDEPARRVILVESKNLSSIAIQFPLATESTPTEPLKPERFRQLLLARWPNAKLEEEFTLSAANQTGPAFDVTWSSQGSANYSRVAFIPTPAGVVEFHLLTTPAESVESKHALNSLLLTFRSNQGGTLDIAPLSNKI